MGCTSIVNAIPFCVLCIFNSLHCLVSYFQIHCVFCVSVLVKLEICLNQLCFTRKNHNHKLTRNTNVSQKLAFYIGSGGGGGLHPNYVHLVYIGRVCLGYVRIGMGREREALIKQPIAHPTKIGKSP